jgi:murein DD-endopeptidase MepM/ murein hydrolase activator NlpD
MPPEHYTILLLSGEKSRFRKLRLSRRAATTVASALGILVLSGAAVTPTLFARLGNATANIQRMAEENESLRLQNEDYDNSISAMANRLNRFEENTGRLARELGVEDVVPTAVGGESPEGSAAHSVRDQELASLRHRAATLDVSLAELGEVFQARQRMMASTPNGMPVEGWFSHGYGWRKDPWTEEREFHRGMDIVADAGTPIEATGDGVISRATRKSDYGKTIDISHGYGYVSRYAHLSELLVRPGQKVRRGDVIGRVGTTGRSTGPHLHYEVFRDDRRVNPWKFLGQKGR